MNQVNEFIQLLLDNLENDVRITLSKRIKYGCRHYYLSLDIDEDKTQKNQNFFRDVFEIHFDNRNGCIELNGYDEEPVIIEDLELLKKWSDILEDKISKNLESMIEEKIITSLNACQNKSLLRQYQMRKLID